MKTFPNFFLTLLMSSAAYQFGHVEFWIFVLILHCACLQKTTTNIRYSKFDTSKSMSCRGNWVNVCWNMWKRQMWFFFSNLENIICKIFINMTETLQLILLTNVRFISYLKWRQISKLSSNFRCLFTFCYLDGANSIKTDLHICTYELASL